MAKDLTSLRFINDLFNAAQALVDATPQDQRKSPEWVKLEYALCACRDARTEADAYQAQADAVETGDDLEVDDSFLVSVADDGVWVSSWSWVPLPQDDEGEG